MALVSLWVSLYRTALPEPILGNSTRTKGYHDREYWEAPVTIHRLVSATRGTDCPTFVWADSPEGDALLARTFAVDVLACPKCHGRMRRLAMVEEPANVARSLAAMGEPTEVPRRSPGRGPPYWARAPVLRSRVLRRQALGDEHDAQGCWVPQTA